jgi:hypothetical protein
MALFIYQPGIQPLGQFDMLDGYLTGANAVLGGEVATLTTASRNVSIAEKAAFDVLDGYVNPAASALRSVLTKGLTGAGVRPLWLLDDGTTGYGTLFGQVIGTPVGLLMTGTNIGPHTAAGSGKVTAWDKPGIYALTLDAADTHVTQGLVLANALCVPGAPLYPTILGLLTPTIARSIAGAGPVVARFIEFETRPFLVTTPASLVGATETAQRAVINYHVE